MLPLRVVLRCRRWRLQPGPFTPASTRSHRQRRTLTTTTGLQPPVLPTAPEELAAAAVLLRKVTDKPPAQHAVRLAVDAIRSSGVAALTTPGGQPLPVLRTLGEERSSSTASSSSSASPHRLNFCDVEQRVMGAAQELGGAGVRPGLTLATYISSPVHQLLAVYGTLVVGATAAPMPLGTPTEIAGCLRAIQPDAILVEEDRLVDVHAALACARERGDLDGLNLPQLIVATCGDIDPPAPTTSTPIPRVNLLAARSSTGLAIAPEVETAHSLAQPCLLLMSSGSTGRPKAVAHSHATFAMVMAPGSIELRKAMPIPAGTLFYGVADSNLAHVGVQGMLYQALCSGASWLLGIPPPGSPASVAEAIATQQPRMLGIYPPMLSALLSAPPGVCERIDWSTIGAVFSGGSSVPLSAGEQLMSRFGTPLMSSWGMTEAGLASTMSPLTCPGQIATGAAGLFDMAVLDPDTGALLQRGQVGELWVRGHGLCRGYWRNPDATAELFPFGLDSWMRTGDLCTISADGDKVCLVGRRKEIMKVRGGGQVAPAELEDVLREHPAVEDVVVVPRPDQRYQEVPVAFVTLAPDQAPPSPQELLAFADARVSEYKRLAEIKFIDSMPLLFSGKADRAGLKARLY